MISKNISNLLDQLESTDSYGGILLARGDETIYEKYFNNTSESQFRIFSCTKPICGLAIMVLIDQKKIKLTDTIDSFGIDIPNASNICVLHLLQHKSGIYDFVSELYFKRNPLSLFKDIYKPDENRTEVLKFETYLEYLRITPAAFQPSTDWSYNNTGYDILGQIISVVSNMNTKDFIRKYIFEPLRMKNSTFHTERQQHLVNTYESSDKIAVHENYNYFGLNGNIITTLQDYNKFMNGYSKLLSEGGLKVYEHLYYFHNTNTQSHPKNFFHSHINSITSPRKCNYFFHMGSGDFSHDFGDNGGIKQGLCNTLAIRFLDSNLNLIIHQNYGGKLKLFDAQTGKFDLAKMTRVEQLIRELSLYQNSITKELSVTQKIWDLSRSFEKNKVQKNLKLLYKEYGKYFTIKFGNVLVPVIFEKRHSNIWQEKFYVLKYHIKKFYNKDLLPFSIWFINLFEQKLDNKAYIANIHRTDDISGSKMVELVLNIQRCLGVSETFIVDVATVNCGNETMELSFIKLLERGITFYMRFGFEFDLTSAFVWGRFPSKKKLLSTIRELIKDIRKIKIKNIISQQKAIIDILSLATKQQKWNEFHAIYVSESKIEPYELYYGNDAHTHIPNFFRNAYNIIRILEKTTHIKLVDYLIELFNNGTRCSEYLTLFYTLLVPSYPNNYYQISYGKNVVTLEHMPKTIKLYYLKNYFLFRYKFQS